jgi:hypothetical protein
MRAPDIRKIARRQFTEPAASADCRELAKALLEMSVALVTIASVPTNTPEPLQATCSQIAIRTLQKWTDEFPPGDPAGGRFDAAFPAPTNRSQADADKGA